MEVAGGFTILASVGDTAQPRNGLENEPDLGFGAIFLTLVGLGRLSYVRYEYGMETTMSAISIQQGPARCRTRRCSIRKALGKWLDIRDKSCIEPAIEQKFTRHSL